MPVLIGLLGGTFDPVHNGHLAVAAGLRDSLDADGVRFILNAIPPHRTPPECPAEHRLAMLEIALRRYERLTVDTRELDRGGPSYSVWTLRSLRRELPEASLCWIVGADAWLSLTSWYHWQEITSLAHVLVVKRPGWELPDGTGARLARDPAPLRRRTAGAAVLVDAPEIEVSASDIRRRIANGEDIVDALPAPVLDYIQRNGLYGYR